MSDTPQSTSRAAVELPACNQILYGNQVCGAPGWKQRAGDVFCTTHWSRWLLDTATKDPVRYTGIHSFGFGVQDGPLCPEYGPGYAELTCWACGASWVGVIGDACWWCEKSLQRMIQWQADLVLTPPDCELTDITRPTKLKAWEERLKKARDAGIITEEEAISVFGRELRRTQ